MKKLYVVKLRVNRDWNRVRKFFLDTLQERAALINAILKAQGYGSELEQYTIRAELVRTEESSVSLATHNVLGSRVVIKSVKSKCYHAKAASN